MTNPLWKLRALAAEAELEKLEKLCRELKRGCDCEYDHRCSNCDTIVRIQEMMR